MWTLDLCALTLNIRTMQSAQRLTSGGFEMWGEPQYKDLRLEMSQKWWGHLSGGMYLQLSTFGRCHPWLSSAGFSVFLWILLLHRSCFRVRPGPLLHKVSSRSQKNDRDYYKSPHDHIPWRPKLFCLKLCKQTAIPLIPISFSPCVATFSRLFVHWRVLSMCACVRTCITIPKKARKKKIYMISHN